MITAGREDVLGAVAVPVEESGVELGEAPTHPARPAAARVARHARLEGMPRTFSCSF
jgi:hypothetical protein